MNFGVQCNTLLRGDSETADEEERSKDEREGKKEGRHEGRRE